MTRDAPRHERSRRADALRNHDHLLGIAEQTFLERGTTAGVEEIARRAYMAPATVFRHFPRKSLLIEAVIDRRVAQLADVIAAAARHTNPAAAFAATMLELVHRHVTERTFVRWLTEASRPDLDERLTTYTAQVHGEVAVVLRRAQDAGVVRRDVTVDDVLQLCSAVGSCYCPDLPRPRLVERYLGIVLDGLRPSNARPLSPGPIRPEEHEVAYQHRLRQREPVSIPAG